MAEGGLLEKPPVSDERHLVRVTNRRTPGPIFPERHPSFQTCHRHFQYWIHSWVMTRIMAALLTNSPPEMLPMCRRHSLTRVLHPLKGGLRSGRQNATREQRSWQSQIVADCRLLLALGGHPHI